MNTLEYLSPLGKLTLAASEKGLTGLWMEGQKYYPHLPEGTSCTCEILDLASGWLDRYFSGQCPSIQELPLAPEGSAFRHQVWELLCRIPYGKTTTYAALARKIADLHGLQHMSAQAVGNAVGHNPISIIIPCHRVVGSSGSLTGYAGGLDRKQWLLAFESSCVSKQ